MASSNMRDVKRRIKSVESTMQITKAMELVASSKLRKAKERAEASRPFFDAIYQTMAEIFSENTFSSIYTKGVNEKAVPLFVVIAGDRGLAGGFNTNVLKLAESRISECKNPPCIITIGKKATEYFEKRTDIELFRSYDGIAEHINIYQSMAIGDEIIEAYRKGKIGNVEMIFNDYVSPMLQEPRNMKILPVEEIDKGEKRGLTTYEPSPQAVFEQLVPKYLSGIIYSAVVDSFAAEQASRRSAMESATDNAKEMIDNLSLLYNRARQTAITQEITEIVGGASATQ